MELRDVHNLIQTCKSENREVRTDEERSLQLLREFVRIDGNSAAVSMNNSSGLVHAVCFQTARQKRLFEAFPEVIMIDTTHGTNKNYYKLFSLLVHDVFGKVSSLCTTICTKLIFMVPDAVLLCVRVY